MNARDLERSLDLATLLARHIDGWKYSYIFEAALMLRQQHAEIEKLKKELDEIKNPFVEAIAHYFTAEKKTINEINES